MRTKIPFTKAHGAKNDFLLTWAEEAPADGLTRAAQAICDRHTGVGADGWLLVSRNKGDADAVIRLFNPDGGEVEMSGNGTRCAAAFLIESGFPGSEIKIMTGAGLKHLRLLRRDGLCFEFEMNMGRPRIVEQQTEIEGYDATLVDVGNPQCAVFVKDFDFDWRSMGQRIEHHPRFPHRTNVSFIVPSASDRIDVRFWERGAGETMSSGTGSTGAMAAAVSRGLARSPLTVMTPAGPLALRWNEEAFLVGPAEIVATGEFYL